MKRMNKKIKIGIFLISLLFVIGLVFFVFKGTYSIVYDDNYTREELQDMVVSTAMSYYYNQNYSDYEQYSMDDLQENPHNNTTFYWRNVQNSPEMVSRSNRYNIDCSSFVLMVYLYSLGYDMSEYKDLYNYNFYENGEYKSSISSIENYQSSYFNYGKGWYTAALSSIANQVSGINGKSGLEYINLDIENQSSIVYFYKVMLDEFDNYMESENTQEKIKNSILSHLKPGDILVYRTKFKETGSVGGHAILYVGDVLGDKKDGFIHATGIDFNASSNPITIGEDTYSVRYDEWDAKFVNDIFISDSNKSSYSFTIIRPINTYCDKDNCSLDVLNIQSLNYKENYDLFLENTIARDELSKLGVEQYQSSGVTFNTLSKYNSLNNGDNIVYNLVLKNKSKFSYCTSGSSSHMTEEKCINNNFKWEETTQDLITYNDLKIVGKIPDGTSYVSCTNGCEYDEDKRMVIWKKQDIKPENYKKYTYTVKISDDLEEVINEGMVITTKKGNNLKLGQLIININPTLNNKDNKQLIMDEVVKFSNLVSDGKIEAGNIENNDYRKDLDLLNNGVISKFGFIKMIYYNSLGIDLGYLNGALIKEAIFDNYIGTGYNVFTKKTYKEVSDISNNIYTNINKMLVPGMYGGRLLKGNDNLDRARFLNTLNLEFGDIIITFDVDNNLMYPYIFYGFDKDGNSVFLSYNKDNNGKYKILRYDSVAKDGKNGFRIFKEIFAQDLFVVLRPTQLYGTTVIYNYNDGNVENKICVMYDNYGNLEIPTRSGYVFDGWYSDSEYNNRIANSSNLISKKTHMLYAKWKKGELNIKFSSDIDVNNNNIRNILPEVTFDNFAKKITTSGDISLVNFNGKVKKNNEIIATGDTLMIDLDNITYNYKISVLGDTTGDGMIDVNDVSKLYRHIKGVNTMSDVYLLAGELVVDGKYTINDVSKLYRYIKKVDNTLTVTQ